MSKLQGEILNLPKMSGSVSTPKSLSGNVGAKTINIGGSGTLFVTVDENMTASHTPAEMAEHIANGGNVFVVLDGDFAAVSACNAEMAAVVIVVPDVEGGTVVGVLTVDAGKAVSVIEMSDGGGDLPNPTDAQSDNVALVATGGKWALSAAPVVTKADLASVSDGISAAHDRIDGLSERVDGLATNQDFLDAVVAAFPKYNGEVETV